MTYVYKSLNLLNEIYITVYITGKIFTLIISSIICRNNMFHNTVNDPVKFN